MEPITREQLYTKYPELKDIATRLEESLVETEEFNKKLKSNEHGALPEGSKSLAAKNANHASIKKYLENGEWKTTVYAARPGRQYFEEKLDTLLARNPDAFYIEVYNGKRELSPIISKTFFLSETKTKEGLAGTESELEEEAQKKAPVTIEEMMKAVDEKMKESGNGKGSDGDRYKILQMQFEAQLKDAATASEKRELIAKHKVDLKELHDEIKSLNEEIDELKEELGDAESDLAGFEKEVAAKEENPIIAIGAKILERGLVGLVVNNKEIGESIGLDEAAKKSILGRYQDKSGKATSTASPGADEFEVEEEGKLDPKHLEGCKIVSTVCRQLPFVEFQKVYLFFEFIADKDGNIDLEKLNKAAAAVLVLEEQEKKGAKKEEATTV
jgi:hypothetical protein